MSEDLLGGGAEWGPLAVALAARALEGRGRGVVSGGPVGLQVESLLGSEWACEYFVDFGARSVAALRGGVEGFVLKGAVLERCDRGGRLVERVLHPTLRGEGGRGAVHLLPVVGGERARQALLYIAELGLVLSLAREGPRGGGRILVVRHGALLQQLAPYFNGNVYNLPCDALRLVLGYSTLDHGTVEEVVAYSRVSGGECNAGLAMLALLRRLLEVGGDVDVVAVAEEVGRTRYLSLHILAELVGLYSGDANAGLLLHGPVGEALECLGELGVDPQEARYDLPRALEETLAKAAGGRGGGADRDPVKLIESLASLGRDEVLLALYKGQALDLLGVSSDAQVVMLYRFLYGPEEPGLTAPVSKGDLVVPAAVDSMGLHGFDPERYRGDLDAVRGVEMVYAVVDPTPSCARLREAASRAGLGALDAADLVRVRHPVKLEYPRGLRGRVLSVVAPHVYTQALATHYGVPAPLLVVDQRSRVGEWDASIVRAVLEEKSRRLVPYSTFVRSFGLRRLYTRP